LENLLIKGDNIAAMQWLLDNGYEGKVDLVYIDPPFATGRKFWVGKGRRNTSTVSSRIKDGGTVAYTDTVKGSEFIEFLRERIVLIHRLLSKKGSLYLHTDCKYSHYIKVMLDEVFGIENFRNDITRIKCNPKNFGRVGYGNEKDVILFYSKSKNPIWHECGVPQDDDQMNKTYKYVDSKGRRYTTVPIHAPGECQSGETCKPFRGMLPPKGRHWRCSVEKLEELDRQGLLLWSPNGNPRKIIYADDHMTRRMQDVWTFKDPLYPMYPTEKNQDMLDMIIRTSSDPGSIVLDCFCGSGTTLISAQNNYRYWIGIDNSMEAISAVEKRFGLEEDYEYKNMDNINDLPF